MRIQVIKKGVIIVLGLYGVISLLSCVTVSENEIKSVGNEENNQIDNNLHKDTIVDLGSNRMVCGAVMCIFEKEKIEIKDDNVLVNKYDVNSSFLDRDGKYILFTTMNDRKIILYDLCKNEEVIYFKLEQNESLLRAVKTKNNRYFVELKVNSNREVYEIETELERLEYVEGDLDHFDYQSLERVDV